MNNYLLINIHLKLCIIFNIIIQNPLMPSRQRVHVTHLLPAPLPIQKKTIAPVSSIINFVEQPLINTSSPDSLEELAQVPFSVRTCVHQIGVSLISLFQNPVYKSHDRLDLSQNSAFCSYFWRGQVKLQQVTKRQSQLQFSSQFQSGNLALSAESKQRQRQYNLALQRDINSTSSTTQWFYYKVKNKYKGIYTFNIVNMVKSYSSFKDGMKICICSLKDGNSWKRGGKNIKYRRNTVKCKQNQYYYTLSFQYQFMHQFDQVYFAYSYPYTCTQLNQFLLGLQLTHSHIMRRKTLIKTIGNNYVDMLLITNPNFNNKKVVYISARVHPGETVSSFVCESVIRFLLSDDSQAEKLRRQFIFKIIPMLNPDGVINGDDLNRQWKKPSRSKHPEIYALKKSLEGSCYPKIAFFDLHGHSKKKSSFLYGCITPKHSYLCRQFAYLFSKKSKYFNYYCCNFSTPKEKQGTSRISVWKTFNMIYSYTYQISFCGPHTQPRHFLLQDLQQLGIDFCHCIFQYFYKSGEETTASQHLQGILNQFYSDKEAMVIGSEDTNGSSSQLNDPQQQQNCNEAASQCIDRQKFLQKRNKGLNNLFRKVQNLKSKELGQNAWTIVRHQNESPKDCYLRNRKTFNATKINIQQINRSFKVKELLSSAFYESFTHRDLPDTLVQSNDSLNNPRKLPNSSVQIKNLENKYLISHQPSLVIMPIKRNQYHRYKRQRSVQNRMKSLHNSKINLLKPSSSSQPSTPSNYHYTPRSTHNQLNKIPNLFTCRARSLHTRTYYSMQWWNQSKQIQMPVQ